jgi:hypothetical protein
MADETLFRFVEENIALCLMGISFSGGIRILLDVDGLVQLIEKFYGDWLTLARARENLLIMVGI